MLHVQKNGAERMDITLSGKIDKATMRQALEDMIEQSEGIEHGRMLYRINDFKMPTMGALGVELAHLPALFRMIRKFDRAAVLADQDWLQKVSEIEGALIPGLEIKAFDLDEQDEAESWLAAA